MTGLIVENDLLRFLALGDSYTIGQDVLPAERWPIQLVESLRESGFRMADAEIIARTGWTTADLLDNLESQTPEGPYDLVSLLIGVNNQFRGQTEDRFRKELVLLLDYSIRLAGDDPSRVFLVTIPDWGVMPFAAGRDGQQIASEIKRFNAILQEEADKLGLPVVDVTTTSRLAMSQPEFVAEDELHPSAVQHSVWVEKILPVVQKILP